MSLASEASGSVSILLALRGCKDEIRLRELAVLEADYNILRGGLMAVRWRTVNEGLRQALLEREAVSDFRQAEGGGLYTFYKFLLRSVAKGC